MSSASGELTEIQKMIGLLKRSFINVGVFSFFINILMLVPPLYMLQVYDRVLTSRSVDTLIMITLIVVYLFLAMGFLEFIRARVLIRLSNKFDNGLNQDLFSSMFKRAVKEPGQVNAQPISDMTSVRQFMTGNGLFAFFDAPWLPIYIGILFVFHPYFGIFGIVAALILFALAVMNEMTTKALLAEANQQSMASSNYAAACVKNAEVVGAMGMEDNLKRKWYEKHLTFLSKQSLASDKASILTNTSKTLRLMFQSLILGLGAYLAIYNEITPGMMIAGSIILGRALAPLDLLINSWKGFSSARSAYKRLNTLFTDYPANENTMALPDPQGKIEASSIMLVPPGGKTSVVKGVSFVLEKGQSMAIIGPSAAGKSSVLRGLLGVWPLLAGKVRLDSADIHQWDKTHLGKHIGYLPQDIELFEGTIAENIGRFGELDPVKVVEASKMAGVHDMVLKLPKGYDTELLSGVSGLSGGQRQRIGLARALYDNPKLVVLDEPNSNLDDQGELALANAMAALKENGVTVIIVSHKKQVLKHVDKILMMVDGETRAFGDRDDVLAALQSGQISLT